MDDGEASDASEHPSIDYLRDSLDEIEAKWMQRARAKVDAPPATSAEQRPVDEIEYLRARLAMAEATGAGLTCCSP
ncbi:MAG: hypothetical protein KA200_00200 [Burkholderiales bacterium]|nr:hypothetical protein [Burkholderiales bacterium]